MKTTTNIDNARNYATERTLVKALEKRGLNDFDPIVVRNRAGRWTAIFSIARVGHDAMIIPHHGFILVN